MQIQTLTKKFQAVKGKLLSLITFHTWRKLESCDVLLYCHDVDRSTEVNGQPFSPILNSFGEELELEGLSTASLALPYCKLLGNRAYGNPLSTTRYRFIAGVLKRLPIKSLSRRGQKYYSNTLSRVFKKCGCKLVVGIGLDAEFCSAARKNGVKTAEIMHGIGYTQIHKDYLAWLPEERPDAFFSLDSVTSRSLEKCVTGDQQVIGISHPWFARLERTDKDKQVDEFFASKRGAYRKVILVTLQWGYDDDWEHGRGIIKNGIMLPEIEEAIKGTPEYLWVLRLHPKQLRDDRYSSHRKYVSDIEKKYPQCISTNMHEVPLVEMIGQCDGHITMNSMACYEAAWLGVTSLTLCPTLFKGNVHADYFEDIIEAGYVQKMKASTEAILNWVHHAQKKAKYKKDSEDSDLAKDFCLKAVYGEDRE